jgi:hypothetical protein
MAWSYRYVEKIPSPSVTRVILGKAVHKAAETDLRVKVDTKSLLPDGSVEDVAADFVRSEFENSEFELTEEEVKEGAVKIQAAILDTSVILAQKHHTCLAPTIDPVAVEKKWDLTVDGHPFTLKGITDVVESNGKVRDLKTSAKTPTKSAADTSLDLTMYALQYRAENGIDPPAVYLDYAVALKKGPKVDTLESVRGNADYQNLLDRISVMTQLINAGIFAPCPQDSWQCSEKYCPFWKETCPYGKRGRTKQTGDIE